MNGRVCRGGGGARGALSENGSNSRGVGGVLGACFFVVAGLGGEGDRLVSHSCVSLRGKQVVSGNDALCQPCG